MLFDGDNIYVAARCWDNAPPDKWIANELRRDTNQMRNNDHFGVGFDTFYDRRSGFMFYANPLGGFSDYSVIDEGAPNTDWNPVWDVRTGRFEGGWTLEMKFPFKSLRYTSGSDQVWGIQFRRSIRHKNEWTYWTPVPQNMAGPQALNRVSAYGTVVGLDLPPAGRNIEIKPYALGKMTTDRIVNPPTRNDNDGDVGGDLKYGVTANLTADLTVNTDFAQVEIDEQQVNLTRFNLFLPEKREFFLEGRGLFDFGRGGAASGGSGGVPGAGFGGSTDVPYLFYSRRIGLNRGRVVPIDVGGRLTGKVGGWGIGVLNIQTGDESASRVTVHELHGDAHQARHPASQHYWRDVHQSQPAVVERWRAATRPTAWTARSASTRTSRSAVTTREPRPRILTGDNESYLGKFDWVPDRYGIQAEFLKVGKAFNPEVGFLRRTDFARSFASARFSPRPKNMRAIRKFTYVASMEYFENGAGDVESRQQAGRFNVELENSDIFNVEANANYDLLVTPFSPGAWRRHSGRRLSLQRRRDVLQHGLAAPPVGQHRRATRAVLQRDDQGVDVLAGPLRDSQAVFRGAAVFDQPDRIAHRQFHAEAGRRPHRLRLLAAHVRERAAAVFVRGSHLQQQRALPMGIPAGQRVLRGVDR